MKNILLPIAKICLVGCSLLLFFQSVFELRLYELELLWLFSLLTGRLFSDQHWGVSVPVVLLMVSQVQVLLSIWKPKEKAWDLVSPTGVVIGAIWLAISQGFMLTGSWILLGIVYAALLVIWIPRATIARG